MRARSDCRTEMSYHGAKSGPWPHRLENDDLTRVNPMRRSFSSRQDLIDYLTESFPEAAARDDRVAPTRGGRATAEGRLAVIDSAGYRSTRNRLDGAVTRLAPFLRHGVVSLREVRDAALSAATEPRTATKLIQELAWRDYYQKIYARIGDEIWRDREAPKTGFSPHDYARELPDDIVEGTTTLACIDGFSRELRETGYLHNHARMWVAAYVVHWRRVRWQAGAKWFLQHLLDGDPPSNNLSWQWVASTFSHKPYIFNRENLERNTNGVYCQRCPVAHACPFDRDYETLALTLFPNRARIAADVATRSKRGTR